MWSDKTNERVKWGIARDFWEGYEDNRATIAAKAKRLVHVFVAVVIQTLVVVLALVLVAGGV